MNRRRTLALLAALLPTRAFGWSPERAQGQEVFWHAWGGDPKINDFIAGLARDAEALGVKLTHVKLASTADAVARVRAEKAAGQTSGGAVDLIWINGENFAAMKAEGLLHGPFATGLPNWPLVDVAGKPATVTDFTVPTGGYESPWAMAQLVFERAGEVTPPASIAGLADWAAANPGRFTYPQPPDYLGLTFLKQVLYALLPDPAVLQSPHTPGAEAVLWPFLDALHPHLWRQGRAFPKDEPALGQLLADGEVLISLSFNPGRASAEIAAGRLDAATRTFVLEGGTIGNASFLAIPFNASAPEGAEMIANLVLSPAVQARAQDPAVLGFQTVLDIEALTPADRALFDGLARGPATLSPAELGPVLLEPHASWMSAVAEGWAKAYAG